MNNEKMNQILTELSKPFHPSRITWRPGNLTEKKDKALALAYADLRAYQNRLDEVCGLDWSVSYTPWGDRLICHLTINGVTRSSTGEPDGNAEDITNGSPVGTATEAQAFKRSCAMFGLGRYLYNLPSVWVEYDTEQERFADKAWAKLNGLVAQHYQRFLEGEVQQEKSETVGEDAAQPAEAAPADQAEDQATEVLTPLQQLEALGHELYGEQWEQVRDHNVKRLVGERSETNGALSQAQIQRLIVGLQKLKRQRQAA
ncbi:MAG: hypothetical protein R3C14_07445 [Caldilineaceae bacterium]